MKQLNYFADSEQDSQQRFRLYRDDLLRPLANLGIRLGINADMVSGFALGMLLPFGILLFQEPMGHPGWLGILFLWLHVGLDGLDGVIARLTKTDGPAGAVTDMVVDHSGFLIVACLLVFAGVIDGSWCSLYVSAYTTSVIMVIALNVLERPLRFVVRTKYFFYVLYSWHVLIGPLPLDKAIMFFSWIHTAFSVVGFLALRRALRETSQKESSPAAQDSPAP